jgi:hypothetical protein
MNEAETRAEFIDLQLKSSEWRNTKHFNFIIALKGQSSLTQDGGL